MFKKILVATDNSATSQTIFETALSLAQGTGASLILLHVLSSEEEGSPYLPVYSDIAYANLLSDRVLEVYQQEWEAFERKGLELLRSRVEEAVAAGVSAQWTQTPGRSGRTICEFARNWGSDLIVIGNRGLRGINELFLGSVSNYVTHHASCSVLVVRSRINSQSPRSESDRVEETSVTS